MYFFKFRKLNNSRISNNIKENGYFPWFPGSSWYRWLEAHIWLKNNNNKNFSQDCCCVFLDESLSRTTKSKFDPLHILLKLLFSPPCLYICIFKCFSESCNFGSLESEHKTIKQYLTAAVIWVHNYTNHKLLLELWRMEARMEKVFDTAQRTFTTIHTFFKVYCL